MHDNFNEWFLLLLAAVDTPGHEWDMMGMGGMQHKGLPLWTRMNLCRVGGGGAGGCRGLQGSAYAFAGVERNFGATQNAKRRDRGSTLRLSIS